MKDPKSSNKDHLKDTDPTDEMGGGGEGLTKGEFFKALDKVISRKIEPDEGKSKTSE